MEFNSISLSSELNFNNLASGKSVGVTINLSNDDIKGMDTSKISAFYYDVASKKWADMGGRFDSAKITYAFSTTHFTDFTIMQKSEVNVNRLSGANRIETSHKLKSLSGSVLAARKNSGVLLVDNKDVTKQKELLSKEKVTNVIVFGGEGVISSYITTSLLQK